MPARFRSRSRLVALAIAMCFALAVPAEATSALPSSAGGRVALATEGTAGDPVSDDRAMRYQGGRVLRDPRVYVVFWGSEWGSPDAKGMPTADPRGIAPIVIDFFGRLGGRGDTWSAILTQYCAGVKINASTCGPGSRRIQRPVRSPLRGWWVDASPAPNQTKTDVATGAWHEVTDRALAHFAAPHPDNIVVLMRPATNQDGQCAAFHTVANTKRGKQPIIVMPYPLPGGTCPENPPVCDLSKPLECQPKVEYAVTALASHEYAETVTNPIPTNCLRSTDVCGWIVKDAPAYASRPAPLHTEISDTCSNYRFAMLNGKKTSVAMLWSNTANGGRGACVVKYLNDKQQA